MAAVVGAIVVGWSWAAFAWLVGSYAVRMFAITAGYHRYFSHRTFKTSRAFQFVLALLAMASAQQGVLWWAAHHRNHHKYSDQPERHPLAACSAASGGRTCVDPGAAGTRRPTSIAIKDFAKYPELRLLDRHDLLVAVAWGFVALLHRRRDRAVLGPLRLAGRSPGTSRSASTRSPTSGARAATRPTDDSRNNALLAVLTFGEGWHNNHHHYQRSARQGFFWWEIDVTYYVLKVLEALRIVWDVEGVPRHVRDDELAPRRVRVQALAAPLAPPP